MIMSQMQVKPNELDAAVARACQLLPSSASGQPQLKDVAARIASGLGLAPEQARRHLVLMPAHRRKSCGLKPKRGGQKPVLVKQTSPQPVDVWNHLCKTIVELIKKGHFGRLREAQLAEASGMPLAHLRAFLSVNPRFAHIHWIEA